MQRQPREAVIGHLGLGDGGQLEPEHLTDMLHEEDLDQEVLISVARVMHTWTPSARVHELEDLLPDLFPEGFDPKSLD